MNIYTPTANQQMLVRLLRESFREHALSYAIAIVAMMVMAGMTAASAWIMGVIANEFVVTKDINRIYQIAGAVAGIFTLKGIASYTQAFFMSRAGNSIIADRQRRIYDRILEHGIEFHNSTSSSDLITRITMSAQAARSVLDVIVTSYVRDLLSLVGLVIVMFVQQPIMSLIVFIFGPMAIFGIRHLLKRVRTMMEMEFLSIAQIIRIVQETAVGARVVKSFALENVMRKQMYKAVSDVQRRSNSIAAIEAATAPLMETLAGLAIAGIILVSGYLVIQHQQTPGEIMSFITAMLLAYDPARRLARVRVSLETGMIGVRMMYEITDRPLTLAEFPGAKPLEPGPGSIKFEDVTFCYRDGEKALDRFNLVFPAGKMTALVGPSGGGKSTVMNLIMRLYDPTEGEVLFDGQDIKKSTLVSVRERISYVSQDTFLFTGTVMHNIRTGRLDATDEEVIEAAKAANAHDFITAMPKGYDTDVGENGALLSGGQRQRLSIARAMLRKSQILLLDEATSALDAESEALFKDALNQLRTGRTTIVIAHRLSTVHQADRIVAMEAGRVVEQGSHKDLLAEGGLYRRLYDLQLLP